MHLQVTVYWRGFLLTICNDIIPAGPEYLKSTNTPSNSSAHLITRFTHENSSRVVWEGNKKPALSKLLAVTHWVFLCSVSIGTRDGKSVEDDARFQFGRSRGPTYKISHDLS